MQCPVCSERGERGVAGPAGLCAAHSAEAHRAPVRTVSLISTEGEEYLVLRPWPFEGQGCRALDEGNGWATALGPAPL
jgi:hypothetical protein